jgi:hypothetical protein
MLDRRGARRDPQLLKDAQEFFEKNADKGWRGFSDILGLRRGRVVPHSQIKRAGVAPTTSGGHGTQEGYAEPAKEGVKP